MARRPEAARRSSSSMSSAASGSSAGPPAAGAAGQTPASEAGSKTGPPRPAPRAFRLGDILLAERVLTRDQLQQGLEAQAQYGARLGTNLVELGFIELDRLSAALSRRHRIPSALQKHFQAIQWNVTKLVPASIASKHGCVPLGIREKDGNKELWVAVIDPQKHEAEDEIGFVVGMRVMTAVAPELAIHYNIEKHYGIRRKPRFLRGIFGPEGGTVPGTVAAAGSLGADAAARKSWEAASGAGDRRGYVTSSLDEDREGVSIGPTGIELGADDAKALAVTALGDPEAHGAGSGAPPPARGTLFGHGPSPTAAAAAPGAYARPTASAPAAAMPPPAETITAVTPPPPVPAARATAAAPPVHVERTPTPPPPAPFPAAAEPTPPMRVELSETAASDAALAVASVEAMEAVVVEMASEAAPPPAAAAAQAAPPAVSAAAVAAPPSVAAPPPPPVASPPPPAVAPTPPTPPMPAAAMPMAWPGPPGSPTPVYGVPLPGSAAGATPDAAAPSASLAMPATGWVAVPMPGTPGSTGFFPAFRPDAPGAIAAPPPPPEPEVQQPGRPALAINDCIARLEEADNRDEIGDLIIDYLRSSFGAGFILTIRHEMALGWKAFGPAIDDEVISSVALPVTLPMLAVAYERACAFKGAPPSEGAELHARLWKLLKLKAPQEVVVVPITLKERVVNLVYAQALSAGLLPGAAVAELNEVCGVAADAYMRLLQAIKSQAGSP